MEFSWYYEGIIGQSSISYYNLVNFCDCKITIRVCPCIVGTQHLELANLAYKYISGSSFLQL